MFEEPQEEPEVTGIVGNVDATSTTLALEQPLASVGKKIRFFFLLFFLKYCWVTSVLQKVLGSSAHQ